MPPAEAIGAPGLYFAAEAPPAPRLGVPMDVCAFVGVAPRGPARMPRYPETWSFDRPCVGVAFDQDPRRSVAVRVDSFDEYRRIFGGFAGPGRLPYAVATYFEQGGRQAYVVRIVHEYHDIDLNKVGTASGALAGVTATTGEVILRARSEGRWGNALRAAIGFSARAVEILGLPDFEAATSTSFAIDPHEVLPVGSLLRLTLGDGTRTLAFAVHVSQVPVRDRIDTFRRVTLGRAVASPPVAAEVVEATLDIDDGAGLRERFENLGLSSIHPRWMATVLCYESELVYPDASWEDADIVPDRLDPLPEAPDLLQSDAPAQFHDGEDRYADIEPDDFFDPDWLPGEAEPGDGVHAIVHLPDVSALAVPDLYHPQPLPPAERVLDPVSLAGATFERCIRLEGRGREQAGAAQPLLKLLLDPADPSDLARIQGLHGRLVRLAERLTSFVVLLDVPPGLRQRDVARWRSLFRSSYAAAYHPWLKLARTDDGRDGLALINPSAVAAGVIARQERLFGVPHGPANALAASVVDVDLAVSPRDHDVLHPLGINVFLRERDGIRLTAGRTLSRERHYRQLSVRRLMLMLRRVLAQQTHWMVFEPNDRSLRAEVRHMLRVYLRQLYRAGAFRGAREEEAFFVRCDDELNPRGVVDAGRLIALIGVAPAEPLEFIVIRLDRGGDRTLAVEA